MPAGFDEERRKEVSAKKPTSPEKKSGLRLVKSLDERPRPEPDPDLKAILGDLNRRSHAQREREPDGKDAA